MAEKGKMYISLRKQKSSGFIVSYTLHVQQPDFKKTVYNRDTSNIQETLVYEIQAETTILDKILGDIKCDEEYTIFDKGLTETAFFQSLKALSQTDNVEILNMFDNKKVIVGDLSTPVNQDDDDYDDDDEFDSDERVMDDEEPEVGGVWRAKQPDCPAVEPFVEAASLDAADAGRPKPSAAGGHTSAELEDERVTGKSRFVSREPALNREDMLDKWSSYKSTDKFRNIERKVLSYDDKDQTNAGTTTLKTLKVVVTTKQNVGTVPTPAGTFDATYDTNTREVQLRGNNCNGTMYKEVLKIPTLEKSPNSIIDIKIGANITLDKARELFCSLIEVNMIPNITEGPWSYQQVYDAVKQTSPKLATDLDNSINKLPANIKTLYEKACRDFKPSTSTTPDADASTPTSPSP